MFGLLVALLTLAITIALPVPTRGNFDVPATISSEKSPQHRADDISQEDSKPIIKLEDENRSGNIVEDKLQENGQDSLPKPEVETNKVDAPNTASDQTVTVTQDTTTKSAVLVPPLEEVTPPPEIKKYPCNSRFEGRQAFPDGEVNIPCVM